MAEAGSVIKWAKNFRNNLERFSEASNYINRAIKWGAVGAGVGGVTEWAGGGSFFEGASGGAVRGALIGAGYSAFKAGTHTATRVKGYGKSGFTGASSSRTVSKQVIALQRARNETTKAQRYVTGRGGGRRILSRSSSWSL
jgi:hypothetical protein